MYQLFFNVLDFKTKFMMISLECYDRARLVTDIALERLGTKITFS